MKWLLISNRWKHLLVGIIMFYVVLFVGVLSNIDILVSNIVSLTMVLSNMLSVEYGLKTCGSKFDWLDVLAGCLIPFISTVVILLTSLI